MSDLVIEFERSELQRINRLMLAMNEQTLAATIARCLGLAETIIPYLQNGKLPVINQTPNGKEIVDLVVTHHPGQQQRKENSP